MRIEVKMKIGELIDRLEKLQDIYGDIECRTVEYNGGEYDENEPTLALVTLSYGWYVVLNG